MTKVYIFKKGDLICGYQVKGHSGYAEEGSDIVCSAVSAATQMTLGGLNEVLGAKPMVDIKDGYLSVELEEKVYSLAEAQTLLKTMEKFLKEIAKQYADYVKLEVKKDVY